MTQLYLGTQTGVLRVRLNGSRGALEEVLPGVDVKSLALDPLRPERILAATAGQGLWRSNDAGSRWNQVGEGIDNPNLWSVAVSRSDRHGPDGTVYVGTEMSAMYRSDDGGTTFRELRAFRDLPSRPEWSYPPVPDTHHVHSLVADPHEPGRVFAGIELGGIMRSRDGGETWEDHNPGADLDPHTLLAHPNAAGRVYEAGGTSYRETRDGGESWRTAEVSPEVDYFYSLAVDGSDPDCVVISAAHDPFTGHGVMNEPAWSTLYRHTASGGWAEVTDGLPPREGTAMGFLASAEPESGVFYYSTIPGVIYRSTDSGLTWTPVAGAADGSQRVVVNHLVAA